MRVTSLIRVAAVALLLLVALPSAARSQSSPIADLLRQARVALNDLRFAEADSLATAVMTTFAGQVTKAQRIEALSIAAASLFPDPLSGGTQRPDSAIAVMRQIVREERSPRFRSDIAWHGLDSLYTVALRSTLLVEWVPVVEYVLTGPDGRAAVEVTTNRAAFLTLRLHAADGRVVASADGGAAGTRATLALRTFDGSRALLADGEYLLDVHGTDASNGDTLTLSLPATISAPALGFVAVPPSLDSARLLVEQEPPARARGFLAALVLGATGAAAATIAGPAPLSAGSSSGVGYGIAAGMAVGAIVAGMMDRGHALPANTAANEQLRAAFAQQVQRAREENARTLAQYRVTVTIHQGVR